MAVSDKYEVRDAYTFEPYTVTGMVYSQAKQRQVEQESEPVKGYEIHAQEKSQGQRGSGEAPGAELRQTTLECQIVRSPTGEPLLMPEGVGAGWRFRLRVRGKPGVARILPTPSKQNPEARQEVGEIFQALWEATD